jgi:aryl-alcohol dehydrogenase-like predicted oxidoreductase
MAQLAPVMLPVTEHFQLTDDLAICPILNGLWQVSGGHGAIDPRLAVEAMFRYHDAGLTTWDLADHYGPSEDFIGEFRRRMRRERGDAALAGVQAFTKWVPNPGRMTRPLVETAIDRSLRRMDVGTIDLLQFHWWDYADAGYLDALAFLAELCEAGKIKHLALTNFDTEHMRRILDRGIRIVSNQVQYSLIDRRPEVEMAAFCREQGIHLLAYGTVCGGLLSERYLRRPEPRYSDLDTASLQKYKQMIDAWGGWPLFQELLGAVKRVADRRGSTMTAVAMRYVLDRPAVAGVIVGARLGVSEHIAENARVFDLGLEAADIHEIEAALSRGRDLFRLIGDCGAEYRR